MSHAYLVYEMQATSRADPGVRAVPATAEAGVVQPARCHGQAERGLDRTQVIRIGASQSDSAPLRPYWLPGSRRSFAGSRLPAALTTQRAEIACRLGCRMTCRRSMTAIRIPGRSRASMNTGSDGGICNYAEWSLIWLGLTQAFREDRSILVAGCGTSQAAKHAMRWPAAQVIGIDLSATSVRATRDLKGRYGLGNLEVRQLPIERAGELGMTFD